MLLTDAGRSQALQLCLGREKRPNPHPVALKRSEVRADPIVSEVKRSGELHYRVASATQQCDNLPTRAVKELLIPVRTQCSSFLCWLFLLWYLLEILAKNQINT